MAKKSAVAPGMAGLESIMPLLPVGAGVDLLTGKWVQLDDGTSVILGGLSRYWAVGGPPNSYKTAFLLYFDMSSSEKLTHVAIPPTLTYDTENSYTTDRLEEYIKKFPNLHKANYVYSGMWVIIAKHMMLGDLWWKEAKAWFEKIIKNKFMVKTPFLDKRTGKKFVMAFPSKLPIDSITEVESTETNKLTESKDLGDKKARMYYMNRGFDKSRILGSLGTMVYRAGAYTLLATHIGQDNAIDQGPMKFATKKFTDMAAGTILKGVPSNFDYLLTHIWLTNTAKHCAVDKMERYPKTQELKNTPQGDLQIVKAVLVRSKTSRSGYVRSFIISQKEGLLPHLTNINDLRDECDRYGMTGDNVRYVLDLYPECKLMRTVLRERIDSDSKLRRAIDITTEMQQTFSYFLYDDPKIVCSPAQLRVDLEKMGYDWDIILESRGWWAIEDETHPVPRLSTMDLLNIRIGKLEAKWAMKKGAKTKT